MNIFSYQKVSLIIRFANIKPISVFLIYLIGFIYAELNKSNKYYKNSSSVLGCLFKIFIQ